MWSNLLKIRQIYLRGRKIQTKNGKKSLFWEDNWLHDKPLCIEHPVLFEFCENKEIIVHEVLSRRGHLTFSRWLTPLLFDEWLTLVDSVFSFTFENQDDIILWRWNTKKSFTTKSVYNHLSSERTTNSYNHIWRAKLPYKIKIFTWLLEKDAILTKENLVKRKWPGNPSCMLCNQFETIDHLFFQCPISKCVWALIGFCLGTPSTPRNCTKYKFWITNWLPQGQSVHHFGFSAVCWAI